MYCGRANMDPANVYSSYMYWLWTWTCTFVYGPWTSIIQVGTEYGFVDIDIELLDIDHVKDIIGMYLGQASTNSEHVGMDT